MRAMVTRREMYHHRRSLALACEELLGPPDFAGDAYPTATTISFIRFVYVFSSHRKLSSVLYMHFYIYRQLFTGCNRANRCMFLHIHRKRSNKHGNRLTSSFVCANRCPNSSTSAKPCCNRIRPVLMFHGLLFEWKLIMMVMMVMNE